jgi:hypothetical protein
VPREWSEVLLEKDREIAALGVLLEREREVSTFPSSSFGGGGFVDVDVY